MGGKDNTVPQVASPLDQLLFKLSSQFHNCRRRLFTLWDIKLVPVTPSLPSPTRPL